MDLLDKIYRAVYRSSLGGSPIDLVIFVVLVLLFLLFLYLWDKHRRIREKKRIFEAYREKWDYYREKYEITGEEAEFIEELARYLSPPEKKYILLVDSHIFNGCLKHYVNDPEHSAGKDEVKTESLARSIMAKAGLKPYSDEVKGIAQMRRKRPRRRVNIDARIQGTDSDKDEETVRMFDLSSRGASLENPGLSFRPGDEISVSFTFENNTFTAVSAEVVRVSQNGRRLHVRFHRRKA